MLATILQLISALAIVVAVVQLTKEIRASNLQSLFYLHQYLAQDTFGSARLLVRTQLHSKPYKEWSAEEKEAANRVCASYDQAGLLLSAEIIPKRVRKMFLASSWGNSICDQYESLGSYLSDRQTPTLTGAQFFRHFTWLYTQASLIHRAETPNED